MISLVNYDLILIYLVGPNDTSLRSEADVFRVFAVLNRS
jgi:hypothetical protein